ncbi:MAG: ATP-dependent protease ATPase subunit HslU, partial [Planctomycetota bacterium]
MTPLTPREIVAELDKHIIGQAEAKRAVAVALRNRWRWRQLPDDVRREIMPKNILMIGPTGVGKTEITRRLADLTGAPFIKVEATKYTEVGYYGRDVESMVRDLVEKALVLVRRRKQAEIEDEVNRRVEERLLDLLVHGRDDRGEESRAAEVSEKTREALRRMLVDGKLEDREVEMTVEQRQFPVQVFSAVGMEQMDVDLQNIFERIVPRERTRRRVKVSEARRILFEQESEAMLDQDLIREEAVRLAEDSGIIFIDEIDKICGPEETGRSADVSRQGVQRDLLPIVEGTTVSTRYGSVRTDHMLFIAAGAFHRSRPSDLMPELQGRFPIRVELHDLG